MMPHPIDPFKALIAAHEHSMSDDFVSEVFELFDGLINDPLFGHNRFAGQKIVFEISTN